MVFKAVRRQFFGDPKIFVEPVAQVDQLATPAAKWAERRLGQRLVADLSFTSWTFDGRHTLRQ